MSAEKTDLDLNAEDFPKICIKTAHHNHRKSKLVCVRKELLVVIQTLQVGVNTDSL